MTEQSLKEKTTTGLTWGIFNNISIQGINLIFGIFPRRLLVPRNMGTVGMLVVFSAIAGVLQKIGFINAPALKKEIRHKDYNAVSWMFVWHTFVWKTIHLSIFSAIKDILPFALITGEVMLTTHFITSSIQNIYILVIAKIIIVAIISLNPN